MLGDSTRLRTSDLLVDVVVGLRFPVAEELPEDGTHQRHLALCEVSIALRAFRLGPQKLTNPALDLPADVCELDQASAIDPSRTPIPERGQLDDVVGHVSSNEQRKTLTKFIKNVKDSPKNLIFCQKCAIFSHINSPMFTMRGERKSIPRSVTGSVRKERRLKGGIEVPSTYEGERMKEKAENNPYGVVEMKKRFVKNEIGNAVPMDTPDRDLVIEKLVDRAYTGPTQSEFFKAKSKAEMRGVIEQVLAEQGMGSEPEPQMTAEEAQAEAARVLEEEMRKRGHEIKKAKKGLESFYSDQPVEGDEVEVVSAGEVSENQTDYKTETVEVLLSPDEEAAAVAAEAEAQAEMARLGYGKKKENSEIIEALPDDEEELPELTDKDIEALDQEDKPQAAAIGGEFDPGFGANLEMIESPTEAEPQNEISPDGVQEMQNRLEQLDGNIADLQSIWNKEVQAVSEQLNQQDSNETSLDGNALEIITLDPREELTTLLMNAQTEKQRTLFKGLASSEAGKQLSALLHERDELKDALNKSTPSEQARAAK